MAVSNTNIKPHCNNFHKWPERIFWACGIWRGEKLWPVASTKPAYSFSKVRRAAHPDPATAVPAVRPRDFFSVTCRASLADMPATKLGFKLVPIGQVSRSSSTPEKRSETRPQGGWGGTRPPAPPRATWSISSPVSNNAGAQARRARRSIPIRIRPPAANGRCGVRLEGGEEAGGRRRGDEVVLAGVLRAVRRRRDARGGRHPPRHHPARCAQGQYAGEWVFLGWPRRRVLNLQSCGAAARHLGPGSRGELNLRPLARGLMDL